MTRRHPRTEAEVREMLEGGLLREGHHFDRKRLLNTGPSANRKLAVRLASFAVDGGAILFGVEDNPPVLKPINLSGLKERVDQVARSRIDEPLHVRTREIWSDEHDSHGYLLVIIPASPGAPHMVDGKYRGRGDTTNIVLSDAEVRRLHAAREAREDDTWQLLDEEIARDPFAEGTDELPRRCAHLFVVAHPLVANDNLLQRALGDDGLQSFISGELWTGRAFAQAGARWSPDLHPSGQPSRSPEGWVVFRQGLGRLREYVPKTREIELLDLELHEDGSVRLYCGRASDWERYGHVAFPRLIAGLTARVLYVASAASAVAEYYGSWGLGVALTGLSGAQDFESARRGATAIPYTSADYRRVTTCTSEALATDPAAMVEELLGKLHRGLGVALDIDALP